MRCRKTRELLEFGQNSSESTPQFHEYIAEYTIRLPINIKSDKLRSRYRISFMASKTPHTEKFKAYILA